MIKNSVLSPNLGQLEKVEARELTNIKYLEPSHVVQVEEAKRIFEELNEEDFNERQENRRNDDFIVDDEGYGYRDHGGEIWESSDLLEKDGGKKKKRKLDVLFLYLTLIQPNEQMITNFMYPTSTVSKRQSGQTSKQKSLPKVSAEQSKNIMDTLIVQLDNQDAEELEDVNAAAAHVLAEMNKPMAFTKEEQLMSKYNVQVGSMVENSESEQEEKISPRKGQMVEENVFSKKRKFEEMAK